MERNKDSVDRILDQWKRERPDLDADLMGPIGRLQRCAALLHNKLENTFQNFGITMSEFDVLAALRRGGAPYCLSPTAIFSTLMITSGTMTYRLQRLEKAGLVTRQPDPQDARSMLAQLTEAGLELIDRAIEAHVENEREILKLLKPQDVELLNNQLAELLGALEREEPAEQPGAESGKRKGGAGAKPIKK
ncbi:MarR family transcriptional regulator [Ectopseudomonas mendocina]|uniref:MarR family transcriptional regulator n=1 Tax=Ectopseudomonas mendocina TaxID=300 RepID=A0ABZ2RGY0_ECTME